MTLHTYVAARVALARQWLATGDRRYLIAYRELKLDMLRDRQLEMIPALVRRQA